MPSEWNEYLESASVSGHGTTHSHHYYNGYEKEVQGLGTHSLFHLRTESKVNLGHIKPSLKRKTKRKKEQWKDSVGKVGCCQAQWPVFEDPYLHDGRRELTLECCPLTLPSVCAMNNTKEMNVMKMFLKAIESISQCKLVTNHIVFKKDVLFIPNYSGGLVSQNNIQSLHSAGREGIRYSVESTTMANTSGEGWTSPQLVDLFSLEGMQAKCNCFDSLMAGLILFIKKNGNSWQLNRWTDSVKNLLHYLSWRKLLKWHHRVVGSCNCPAVTRCLQMRLCRFNLIATLES